MTKKGDNLKMSDTKEMLMESTKMVKRLAGFDPSKPGNTRSLLTNDSAYNTYIKSLAEGLEKKDQKIFEMLAENTKIRLLENSMNSLNPYESLTLPILRVFYPKLIAKEAVTMSPMDKPETIKSFITAKFSPSNSSTQYDAPSVNQDISGGPTVGTPVAATMSVPQTAYDVLATQSLTSSQAHLEMDFNITAVNDGTSWTSVDISTDVEGYYSSSVTTPAGTDVISGKVDNLNGTITIASAAGIVTSVRYTVSMTLEENAINPSIELDISKIRLYSKDRQISAKWTINLEQDMRALFDVSTQAEVVNLLGQQLALDIDREIITNLITENTRNNSAATHTDSFTRTPPASFTWGIKLWHENILPPLNKLSAQIYSDTNMASGNTILANPIDVAILEDLQGFNYNGTSDVDGEMGYRSATVQGGKWKVLTRFVVPKGTMILIYKSVDALKAVYFFSPYVPAVLHPYPIGLKPSLTILSRYALASVRPAGIATLSIGA